MSNTIKLKRSSVATSTPTAGSLEYGELALNYTDGNLFFKTAVNVVTLLASTRTANYSGNVNAGNLSTGGLLNVTGNATVGNIGATNAVFTNIAGTLTTAAQTNITSVGTLGSLTVTNAISGSVTGSAATVTGASQANITSLGTLTALSVTGNVAGSYFIGDGSLLTNLPAQAGNAISNGTSNVTIPTSSGNVTVGVNGDANTVVISPGSIFVNGLFASPKTITSNVQMAADSTAAVISPLTIGNGYNMSIPTSSTVYVWIPS